MIASILAPSDNVAHLNFRVEGYRQIQPTNLPTSPEWLRPSSERSWYIHEPPTATLQRKSSIQCIVCVWLGYFFICDFPLKAIDTSDKKNRFGRWALCSITAPKRSACLYCRPIPIVVKIPASHREQSRPNSSNVSLPCCPTREHTIRDR